jgi:uncharacterized protein YcbX
MAVELVGHVQALWRYPIKSMLGERLQLSQRLGRKVSLLDQSPVGASLDQYCPLVEGRDFQFFDACPIQAITDELEILSVLQAAPGP